MRKSLILALCALLCIGVADAAVRNDTTVVNRNSNTAATTSARSATTQKVSERSAATTPVTISRTAGNTTARDNAQKSTVSRAATNTVANSARTAVTSTARNATIQNTISSRAASSAAAARSAVPPNKTARAAATATSATSNTFGPEYNTCRDAYFTCMDQFCATADETYRRCVCSSRLEEIKTKQRALNVTADQLQDFKDLNIDAVTKTGAEVKAMLTATTGEATAESTKDKSDSANKLAGISSVLAKTKSQSLSTQGKLDIAGDINAIWSTTDLASGSDIMNMTGEKLYNAVHAQCSVFAQDSCDSTSTLNMVVSAYGMYIENDCTTLSNSLAKQTTSAQGTIRETGRELESARLDNYNAHNSTSINECIAQVRKDITADSACGKDYVHCLDVTGLYLNRDTGEPIYTANFYQLESMTSLSGDVLTSQTNRLLINELNKKKEHASRGLDTCRDLADGVWEEFLRQAVTEIYQGQQDRIRQVKNECIDIVNGCYDTQSKSLKDFSNVKDQLLIGSRLELSEQMCKQYLDACSNVYGGGDSGLEELITTMKGITEQKIAQNCKTTLEEYVQEICAVTSIDTLHNYPYGCRTYTPGEQRYATESACNTQFSTTNTGLTLVDADVGALIKLGNNANEMYTCGTTNTPIIKFTSCSPNFYMALNGKFNTAPQYGNRCLACPDGFSCPGGQAGPTATEEGTDCGTYIGSLYQKMVRYAIQSCERPSGANNVISTGVLADVNMVMDSVKAAMGKQLSAECDRLGGAWIDTPWIDNKNGESDGKHDKNEQHEKFSKFYEETSSDDQWGYCMKKLE